jgi:hypothetical protein
VIMIGQGFGCTRLGLSPTNSLGETDKNRETPRPVQSATSRPVPTLQLTPSISNPRPSHRTPVCGRSDALPVPVSRVTTSTSGYSDQTITAGGVGVPNLQTSLVSVSLPNS